MTAGSEHWELTLKKKKTQKKTEEVTVSLTAAPEINMDVQEFSEFPVEK